MFYLTEACKVCAIKDDKMSMKARSKGPAVRCVCVWLPLSVYGFCLVLFSLITVQVLKTTRNVKNASHCAVILLYKGSNSHSQFKLQVFSLSFGSIQRDSKRGLHIRAIHLTGEVDLQLIVVNCKTKQQFAPFKDLKACM